MLNENTKYTLTLGRLMFIVLAIVGASFTIGMSYQSLMPDRELQKKQTEEIADIKVTLARVTTILESMEEKQKNQASSISNMQSKTHLMNAEIQYISSFVQEKRRLDRE